MEGRHLLRKFFSPVNLSTSTLFTVAYDNNPTFPQLGGAFPIAASLLCLYGCSAD
jgi:hypothetical protein